MVSCPLRYPPYSSTTLPTPEGLASGKCRKHPITRGLINPAPPSEAASHGLFVIYHKDDDLARGCPLRAGGGLPSIGGKGGAMVVVGQMA